LPFLLIVIVTSLSKVYLLHIIVN